MIYDTGRSAIAKIATTALTLTLTLIFTPLSPVEQQPDRFFRHIFSPEETNMKITIEPLGFEISLLTGRVSIPRAVVEHSEQGKFATMEKIEFPLGLLLGAVPPQKVEIKIEKAALVLDLSKKRFWNESTVDGKPLNGAPDLVVGKIAILSATMRILNGKEGGLTVKNTAVLLSQIDIPAEDWCRGDAPAGRWAKISMKGGKISLEDAGLEADLVGFEAAFDAAVMHIEKMEIWVADHGNIGITGKVIFREGVPERYDMTISLVDFLVCRQDPACSVTGNMKLKGRKNSLSLRGTLLAKGMRKQNWWRQRCASKIKIDLRTTAEEGGKKTLGSIAGTLCQGKMIPR